MLTANESQLKSETVAVKEASGIKMSGKWLTVDVKTCAPDVI